MKNSIFNQPTKLQTKTNKPIFAFPSRPNSTTYTQICLYSRPSFTQIFDLFQEYKIIPSLHPPHHTSTRRPKFNVPRRRIHFPPDSAYSNHRTHTRDPTHACPLKEIYTHTHTHTFVALLIRAPARHPARVFPQNRFLAHTHT